MLGCHLLQRLPIHYGLDLRLRVELVQVLRTHDLQQLAQCDHVVQDHYLFDEEVGFSAVVRHPVEKADYLAVQAADHDFVHFLGVEVGHVHFPGHSQPFLILQLVLLHKFLELLKITELPVLVDHLPRNKFEPVDFSELVEKQLDKLPAHLLVELIRNPQVHIADNFVQKPTEVHLAEQLL